MLSVHQHWDRLKTCIVGSSYPPEFYSYIKNSRVRNVMERIAIETEEDYQKLIKLLQSFNVEVLRPEIQDSIEYYRSPKKDINGKNFYISPPMTPRDYGAMIGNNFYMLKTRAMFLKNISTYIKSHSNTISFYTNANEGFLDSGTIARIGKDLYFGTDLEGKAEKNFQLYKDKFKDYRCHLINTEGHADGVYCPVTPGLIISLDYLKFNSGDFPNWEIIRLPRKSWDNIVPFKKLKEKNQGKWWVPGEELNDDFTEYVESWLSHWVGYVEETVFDINMLILDKNTVLCNNYNKEVFDAFEKYGITPHIINFRHRFFWDGGLHCITQDLDREGELIDYFPDRKNYV